MNKTKKKFIEMLRKMGQMMPKEKPTDKEVPYRNDMQKYNIYPKPNSNQ